MKFTVSISTILKQISALSGVVSSNPAIPILENFLFEISGGMLRITASDINTFMIAEIPVEADQDGSIAIPAKMLTDTLKNLPEQPVTFLINFENSSVEVISENGRYKLAAENAADFPSVPELLRSERLLIPSDVLVDAISYTLFATSNDELKPAMNGVFFNFTGQHANFVSSDSHRLVRYRREDVKAEVDTSVIIHKRALSLLKNILPSERTEVTMQFNDQMAFFSFGHNKLVCRLIDERFPDYENVIPLNNDNQIILDRQALLGCLKRIVIYANKSTSQVRFKIAGNELVVSAEDLDFANEANERLFCEHEGGDLEIGFNAKFLIEMLNNVHSDKVMLKLSEPGMAGLMEPAEQAQDEHLLMLVMPIMLHNHYYSY